MLSKSNFPLFKEIPCGTVIGQVQTMGVETYEAGRPGFSIAVHYTLEDGRVITSRQSRERKKDVLPSVDSANESAKAGAMEACFNDSGEFWGTTQKFTIGARGLVPCAA